MDLIEAMKTVGTCRRFEDREVPDDVLVAAVEAARFAPQGGNRQPVRFVVVRDAQTKQALHELYLRSWEPYVKTLRERATGQAAALRRIEESDAFARGFGAHPAIVVVCAHLPSLLATDAHLGRLSIVGGASVYPTVQNLLLALRSFGVGSAITTLLCAHEQEVKSLLFIPEDYGTACHIAVGYHEGPFPTSLKRLPVDQLLFGEAFGQPLRHDAR